MAKRFTATEKWIDPWFCGLTPINKLFWFYLLDNCDHAGIWKVNAPLLKFHMGETEDIDYSVFEGRVRQLTTEKWFIPKFIEFQYGELNPENRAHLSVIRILEKEGAYKEHVSSLLGPVVGRKDKDKDKDKDKEPKEKKTNAKKTDVSEEWVDTLLKNELYEWVDIYTEIEKMKVWIDAHPGRKLNRAFVVNWLNKAVKDPVNQRPTKDCYGLPIPSKEQEALDRASMEETFKIIEAKEAAAKRDKKRNSEND